MIIEFKSFDFIETWLQGYLWNWQLEGARIKRRQSQLWAEKFCVSKV